MTIKIGGVHDFIIYIIETYLCESYYDKVHKQVDRPSESIHSKKRQCIIVIQNNRKTDLFWQEWDEVPLELRLYNLHHVSYLSGFTDQNQLVHCHQTFGIAPRLKSNFILVDLSFQFILHASLKDFVLFSCLYICAYENVELKRVFYLLQ